MASDKYFVFRSGEVNEFSEVFSNTGDNLSVLSISADHVAYITAKKGSVVLVFNNAGLYETFQGEAREALPKTRMEVACTEGEEYQLVKKITAFITTPATNRRVMEFDAVSQTSSFNEAAPTVVKPLLPKQPVVMSTQVISNDPASTDLTQTTTTTLDGVTFTAPSLMPIVDYNSVQLASYSAGSEVGQTNHWHNAGTGGSTYDMDSNTGAPSIIDPSASSGLREKAANIAAAENLIMANTLTVEDDYTLYFVNGTTAYFTFGSKMFDNGGAYMNIGFAKDSGYENTNSEFWIQHNLQGASLPVKMQLNNTNAGTTSYTYPDPFLEEGSTVWKASIKKPQTCYVFILRRDKDTNLYLHNHLGEIVGYAPANKTGTTGRTDGDLVIKNIGTGFRGYLARWGCITSDIGAAEAARIAKDLHNRYAWRY